MSDHDSVTVGFDPGGENGFGWAVVIWQDGVGAVFPGGTDTANNAEKAFEHAGVAFERARPSEKDYPIAVGIDAPLFWTRDPSGRKADAVVKKIAGGSVLLINSLRGACLVQGVLLMHLIQRSSWQHTEITETHPVALWKHFRNRLPAGLTELLGEERVALMKKRVIRPRDRDKEFTKAEKKELHVIDAIISAYAARVGQIEVGKGWCDLKSEEDPEQEWHFPWPKDVRLDKLHYWFPVQN